MLESAKLFIRGPVWMVAAVVSVLSTGKGVVEIVQGEPFWMWLFISAFAVASASFWSFHRERIQGIKSLPGRLDALIREGSKVVTELSEPVQPTETEAGVFAMGLFPEEERWGQALELDEQARELLLDGAPALLDDYAEAANASLRRDREKREAEHENDQQDERLGEAERFARFVNRSYQRPASYARAFVTGIAAARKRLGY
jgi:hypothetical protein